MEFPTMNNFWDLSQTPSQFSQLGDDDFLALLQKQYPNTVPDVNATDVGAVNPQSIQKAPLPSQTPPSDDSSPSPPSINSINHPRSRHQSTYSRGNDNEESALKRKASDDDMEEGPSSKNQHTADDPNSTKKGSISRRKSGGSQDDTRLLKRKEQNRAAQRAFRERKEKHVKDLEDKVAALEAKNKDALNENSNLRDLLARLQEENLALKQAQFTFSMPKPIDHSQASSSASPPTIQAPFSFFGSPPAVPHPTPPTLRTTSPKPFSDIDWSSLTTFDPTLLTAMDDIPSGPMQVDSSNSPYGQYALPAPNQYKTLATNTFFMSFADTDSSSFNNGPISNETVNNTSNGLNQFPFNFPSPSNSWNSTRNGQSQTEFSQSSAHSDYMQNHSLDELFGGTFMNGQGSVDFGTLMKSPPAPTVSPVTHANGNGNGSAQSPSGSISSQNSVASPLSAHPIPSPSSASTSNGQSPFSWTMSRQDAESPPSASESSSNVNPRGPIVSREDVAKHIAASGDSPFTSPPFSQPAVRKTSDFSQGGSMIACEGSQFPKTKENPANIDVLKAWRTITSHPQFKDADINHLCTEFTKKARCDGTKVVLEPEGVHHILETFKAKSLAQQQQTSPS
ncbi:uncharacterized protein F5891DRAFT_994144 [Suillus fuscotomentosus]|uniref:BZIP domain-containing protein n=1 Tax=Suillus fuscotomentosus TaxID=1912939 RepID=A0AAD4HU56_9AGAM|nr:uncharacterized protein F5891DRAFT_994144 [Suillus fuscotomentosus]KAG1908607.1 hypothetical protein F5891DRAFT_994144 [Suillus fuscotomentosus]